LATKNRHGLSLRGPDPRLAAPRCADRLDLAFARPAEKVYVQHRLRENAAELWRWLEEGAHFYVCGDAKRMAKDVEDTLLQIAAEQGGKGFSAKAWLDGLAKAGRYQRDVY
jgi:sulfite reductase (NADPH) flavoprotein alpha-component